MSHDSSPILIIGPSGIGKNAACSIAQQRLPNLAFADLDEISGELAFRMQLIPNPCVQQLLQHVGGWQRFLDF